jgi:hypothetical protein
MLWINGQLTTLPTIRDLLLVRALQDAALPLQAAGHPDVLS